MSEVFVKKVIISHQLRRGDGDKTPIRIIKQVFDFKGNLIAEKDPCPDAKFTVKDMMNYADFLLKNDLNNNSINSQEFIKQYSGASNNNFQ